MGLEGQYAARNTALLCLAAQQCQHSLVAPVHSVKVANGDSTRGCHAWMIETAKDLHEFVIFLIAGSTHAPSACSLCVTETGYIVTQQRAPKQGRCW